jgi:hypothetical protein
MKKIFWEMIMRWVAARGPAGNAAGGRRFVEVPEVCGSRMSAGEVQAALLGAQGDARVRALLQLLWLRREQGVAAVQTDAHAGRDVRFQAGGVSGLEELLDDVVKVMEGKPMPADVAAWFGQDQPGGPRP